MAMPKQLQRGLLVKRYSQCRDPRPIAEELSQININDLNIPRDQKTYTAPNISLRYPQLSGLRLTCNAVEFSHNGRTQTFRLKPIKTGFGYSTLCLYLRLRQGSHQAVLETRQPRLPALPKRNPRLANPRKTNQASPESR